MRQRRYLGVALAIACALGGTPARASEGAPPPQVLGSDPLEQPLSDTELSVQRGGFTWNGLDIRFGAEIRSYLGDALVMKTNITWNDTSADVQRTVSAALTPAAAADLRTGMLAGSGLTVTLGGGTVFLANQGQTAFIQRTDGTIQNIIVNTASNVDLRQQVDAVLDIAHFAPFQTDVLAARIGSALSAAGGLGSIRGMRN